MRLLTRLLALVALTLLPIVGIEIYDEADLRTHRAEEGRDQALRLARLVAQQQTNVVAGAQHLLMALAQASEIRNRNPAACHSLLSQLAPSYKEYVGIVSLDDTGHVVCSGGSLNPPASLGENRFFREAMDTRRFSTGVYTEDLNRNKIVYLAQPYFDGDQKPAGVVALALSLDWLNAQAAANPLPDKSTISVVDHDGTILVRHPGEQQFVGTKIPGATHTEMLSGGEAVRDAVGFDGISRIYSYTPVPGERHDLTVSVGLDKGDVMQTAAAANRRDALAIAGSCILAALLAVFGARFFIARPINTLLNRAEHWRRGDFSARVSFGESRSEFGRLGAAFNAMAEAIAARESELERRVAERTEALTEAMHAQQAAEISLYEAQKVETVGRLTGGVAHDFNNLLAAIVGNLELLRARLDADHPVIVRVNAALQSANRGAALVQQLLAFARRQTLHPKTVDLSEYVNGATDMLQRLLRSDVTVEANLLPGTWPVCVDPNQLEAAILNLAVNARDAMPQGGVLGLSTQNVSLDHASPQYGLTGDFVALTVSDTGTGIPAEILEKVFDPFFTTKDVGSGSGLGLSMVQGFARQSQGAVTIESVVGKGTAITLYLPRGRDAELTRGESNDEPAEGEGTVLLVDDDQSVRGVTAEMLTSAGYNVVMAGNAAEAVATFRMDPDRFDILITDLVLVGGASGIDLAVDLRVASPDLPILLVTGYSDALLDDRRAEGLAILTKPYSTSQLTQAARDALRKRRPNHPAPTLLDAG